MSGRAIRILKPVVFVVLLLPALLLVQRFITGNLGSDPVQSLTHFTGDWAVYTLLASLAITPVRKLSGKLAWLVRFRRMVGLFAFFYATLHLLTYVFLFSGFDLGGTLTALRSGDVATMRQDWIAVWPTMVADVEKRRFIQVGLLAWVILLALAVTSPQWMLRKLGGRTWGTLHRCVYGAGVLAIIHYWWLVKRGNLEPLRDTVVLVVVLASRPVWALVDKRRAGRRAPLSRPSALRAS